MFPARERRSFRTTWIRVKREGVVKYENNVITVEREGRILHKFQNIQVLQVFNRIEGYLTFYSNSMPQERNFPGYGENSFTKQFHNNYIGWLMIWLPCIGFLQIGNKIVYYIQTIVDPRVRNYYWLGSDIKVMSTPFNSCSSFWVRKKKALSVISLKNCLDDRRSKRRDFTSDALESVSTVLRALP